MFAKPEITELVPAVASPIAEAEHNGAVQIQVDPAIGGILNNRLAVVGILALVGPLGLPALWLSRRFSKPTKIITTVLFLLVTVVMPLALAFYWLEIALRPLADAMHQANQ